MKTIILLTIFTLLHSAQLFSEEVEEPLTLVEKLSVQSLTVNQSQGQIIVFFFEKASFHRAPLSLRPCFDRSIKSNKQVEVTMDPQSLLISKCQVVN